MLFSGDTRSPRSWYEKEAETYSNTESGRSGSSKKTYPVARATKATNTDLCHMTAVVKPMLRLWDMYYQYCLKAVFALANDGDCRGGEPTQILCLERAPSFSDKVLEPQNRAPNYFSEDLHGQPHRLIFQRIFKTSLGNSVYFPP